MTSITLIPQFVDTDAGWYIEHLHFDVCPCCGEEYAPTDFYGDIIDTDAEVIRCESCGGGFRKLDGEPWDYIEVLGYAEKNNTP